jgi:glutaredoxin
MGKILLSTLLFLFIGIVCMQAQKMQIVGKSENGKVVYVGTNNTSTGFYVMLTITGSGFSMDRENGMEQYVPAHSEKRLAILTPGAGGMDCHMKARYSDQSFSGEHHYVRQQSQKSSEVPVTAQTLASAPFQKGITIFTQNNCSRSQYSREFLRKNYVNFTDYNVSNNNRHMDMMWKELEASGYWGTSINAPVVIVDGQVYQNIPNLREFLEGLKWRN